MKRMILAGLFASMMLAAMPLSAAQVNWQRMAVDIYSTPYYWSTQSWSGVNPPVAGDDVGFALIVASTEDNYPTTVIYDVSTPVQFGTVDIVDRSYNIPVTLRLDTSYTLSADTVWVEANGELALSGGTLGTNVEKITGYTTSEEVVNAGHILQTAGSNVISGMLDIVLGTYEFLGGVLHAAEELIEGGGKFVQTGGTNTVGSTLTVDGTYSLRDGSLLAITEIVGDLSAGVFTQSGGTNDVSGTLTIGLIAYGTYDLSDGTLASSNLSINNGIFNQSGGTSTLGIARIGWSEDGFIGRYDLSGGVLSADSVIIGAFGTGIFGHTGGTSQINRLTLGRTAAGFEGLGTYRLEGTGVVGSPARLTAGFEYIGYSGTGVFDHYGSLDSVHTAGLLYIGYDTGGNGTYTMHGNVLLEAGDEVVGREGNGSFTQHMGTNRIGSVILTPGEAPVGSGTLTIGELLGGTGVYSMNPTVGIPELWASTEVIGNYGTGTFTQYGGTNTVAGDLYLGRYATGVGNFTLIGSESTIPGVHTPATELTAVNEYIGDVGSGSFTHTGGNNTLSGDLYLGRSAGGIGSYTLSGSGGFSGVFIGGVFYSSSTSPTKLTAVNEYTGVGGTGTFDHNSGNNTLSGDLHVGGSGAGTYNLGGGELHAANIWIGAGAGTGTFTHTGGSNNVTNILTVGAHGTYTLNGQATLIAGGIINNGTFNFSGGSLGVPGSSQGSTGPNFTNNGTVKTTDTTVTFNGNFINNGAYISDPSTNIFSNLTVGTTGYLVGALGDVFRINGDFIVTSLMDTEWNTSGALLEFSSGIHTLDLRGSTVDFRFGALQIDGGGYFSDSSDGTISADVLTIYDFPGFLTGFLGNGIHINYGSLFAFDADGIRFDVTGAQLASLGFIQTSGTQAPVPEPSTMLLLPSGLAGLAGYGRRRIRKN